MPKVPDIEIRQNRSRFSDDRFRAIDSFGQNEETGKTAQEAAEKLARILTKGTPFRLILVDRGYNVSFAPDARSNPVTDNRRGGAA